MTHKDANPISRLATVLLLVGVGKLVLGAMILSLAFTGYDTPKPVNGPLLLVAINLLMLGGGCLTASRAFQNATVEALLVSDGRTRVRTAIADRPPRTTGSRHQQSSSFRRIHTQSFPSSRLSLSQKPGCRGREFP